MNWDTLGTIAEIVGAIAVLVTLIYLSIQTRLARIAVEETSEHAAQQGTKAAQEMYSEWRRTVLSNSEIADVLVNARGDEALTEKEQILFSTYFEELFFTAVISHRSVLHNTSGYTGEGDIVHMLSVMNANPRAFGEWRRVAHIVAEIGPEFVEAVEKGLAAR